MTETTRRQIVAVVYNNFHPFEVVDRDSET